MAYLFVCCCVLIVRYDSLETQSMRGTMWSVVFVALTSLSSVCFTYVSVGVGLITLFPVLAVVVVFVVFDTGALMGFLDQSTPYFQTPFVPIVPCIGIYINTYLIVQLPWGSLVRVLVCVYR